MLRHIPAMAVLVTIIVLRSTAVCDAQLDFEREPIEYHQAVSHDAVAKLQERIDSGEVELAYDDEHGYLPAVLEHLGISPESQMLVFSKTSFQLRKINPRRPRAVYFNDDAYVGWVQRGDVVEVTAVDPKLGAVFYTLSQEASNNPKFIRDQGQCMACHASSRTQGVPGHLVRSVFPDRAGQPHFGSGTYTIDHRSPFEKRWGGWYVTGTHGDMRHMGNVVSLDRDRPQTLDREAGANIVDLSSIFPVEPYLRPSSDIVSLMVLEHQTQTHNAIAFAQYESRLALHYDQVMNEALERSESYRSESYERRVARAVENLVEHLLFVDEFKLESTVEGSSAYAQDFEKLGPFDSKGRSLRQFDLQTRMFRYPCSYLIYSNAFDALPDDVRELVANRLTEILEADPNDAQATSTPLDKERYAHLSTDDRKHILKILMDTKPELFEVSPETSAH